MTIKAIETSYKGYRLYSYPGYENSDGSIDEHYVDEFVATAISVARGARFEFGESGARK